MIRYRPRRATLSLSVKDELVFDSLEDLHAYVLDRWRRVAAFLGASDPIRPEEVVICEASGDDPIIGLRNVRMICVTRTAGVSYPVPHCIGFCGE